MNESFTERTPRKVFNRDIPALSEVLPAMELIRRIEERRAWQRERMLNITQHITGMPGGGQKKDYADTMALLGELDEQHERLCREYAETLQRAEDILNAIPCAEMRAFVLLLYVLDAAGSEVQIQLNLSRREFEQARRAVEKAPCMAKVVWPKKFTLAGE